jgi:hypothetical protein
MPYSLALTFFLIFPRRAGRYDLLQYGGTWYSAVPTIHQILLARAPQDNPPKVRFTICKFQETKNFSTTRHVHNVLKDM